MSPTQCVKSTKSNGWSLERDYIIPKPFDPQVLVWVASAVARAAIATGVARVQLDIEDYKEQLARRLCISPEVMRVMDDFIMRP